MTCRRTLPGRVRSSGQALVEFALALPLFLLMLVAVFDFGRGVYTYNGLAQAAREISRVAAVHPGVTLGASPEVQDRIAVQDQLIPGMSAPTFSCLSVDGTPSPHNPCASGDYVQVTVTSVYRPMTMTGWNGAITLSASSSSMIP